MTKAPSRTRRRPSPLIWREARAMSRSRILGVLAFASLAIVTAPTFATSPTTTDTVEQKAKRGAHDTKTVTADW